MLVIHASLPTRFGGNEPKDPSRNPGDPREGTGTGIDVLEKVRTEEPKLYKVILLNDDYTPMEFVVLILKKFFHRSQSEAEGIMMQVHLKGSGVAGIFTREIAETKVFQVQQFAKRHKHPLSCTMEEV